MPYTLVFLGEAKIDIWPSLFSKLNGRLLPKTLRPLCIPDSLPERSRRDELADIVATSQDCFVFQFICSSSSDGAISSMLEVLSLTGELAKRSAPGTNRVFEVVVPQPSFASAMSWVERVYTVTKNWPARARCVSFGHLIEGKKCEPELVRWLQALASAEPSRFAPGECLSTMRLPEHSRHFITCAEWFAVPDIEKTARLLLEEALWEHAVTAEPTSGASEISGILERYSVGRGPRDAVECYLRERDLRDKAVPELCAFVAGRSRNLGEFFSLLKHCVDRSVRPRDIMFAQILDESRVTMLERRAQLLHELAQMEFVQENVAKLVGYPVEDLQNWRKTAAGYAADLDVAAPFPPLLLVAGEARENGHAARLRSMQTAFVSSIVSEWRRKLLHRQEYMDQGDFEKRGYFTGKSRVVAFVPEAVTGDLREEIWPFKELAGVVKFYERN